MEPKTLNFPDAMRLAHLVLSSGMTNIEMSMGGISTLLESLQPIEFLEILSLLARKNLSKEMSGNDALIVLLVGLQKNKINELLIFARGGGTA